MEFPIILVLLVPCLLTVSSHPKNSDVIPKDYYKRQILQPIPGYIPVYIQQDPEPVIKIKTPKQNTDVHPYQLPEPEEESLSETKEDSVKSEEKSEPVKSESQATEEENPSIKSQEKV